MSAGSRIAERYRQWDPNRLQDLREETRNPRVLAAIDIVVAERKAAHQEAFDATQIVLDATGGHSALDLHATAIDRSIRHWDAGRWLEAERAMGVADALWDYLRERSDT